MHSDSSRFWPVNKADTMCYLIYWVHLGYICSLSSNLSIHSVLAILLSGSGEWINQPRCVSYFNGYHLYSLVNGPVIKAETVCEIFYWVYLGLIYYWTLIYGPFYNWLVNKEDTFLYTLLDTIRVRYDLNGWLKKTVCVGYFIDKIWGTVSDWTLI